MAAELSRESAGDPVGDAPDAAGREQPIGDAAAAADGEQPVAGSRSSAVFFDLDRTLMEGSSAFQFGRAAYRAGLLTRRRLVADALANMRFRLRGATDEATHALRDRISGSLTGTRVKDLERLGADVLAGILPRIYPEMLAVAYEHQDAGRSVYIVTAASHDLAELLATVLALDGAIGSQFSEVVDGVFTGRPTGLFIYGADKAHAIDRLANRLQIDLAASYAYSDSASDLPMLRLVGHPVAVNPDPELARVARGEGWEILRFDRLRRRLQAAAALAGAAVAGGAGSAALAARARRRAEGYGRGRAGRVPRRGEGYGRAGPGRVPRRGEGYGRAPLGRRQGGG